MPLLNYTTKVNAQKTATEVMGLLVPRGPMRYPSSTMTIGNLVGSSGVF